LPAATSTAWSLLEWTSAYYAAAAAWAAIHLCWLSRLLEEVQMVAILHGRKSMQAVAHFEQLKPHQAPHK
jgi:hypothetical protein